MANVCWNACQLLADSSEGGQAWYVVLANVCPMWCTSLGCAGGCRAELGQHWQKEPGVLAKECSRSTRSGRSVSNVVDVVPMLARYLPLLPRLQLVRRMSFRNNNACPPADLPDLLLRLGRLFLQDKPIWWGAPRPESLSTSACALSKRPPSCCDRGAIAQDNAKCWILATLKVEAVSWPYKLQAKSG